MKMLSHLALLLLVVGGLNWGLVGVANYNLVEVLFGSWPVVVAVVYDLVGLAALFMGYQMAMCAAGKGGCCASDCKM